MPAKTRPSARRPSSAGGSPVSVPDMARAVRAFLVAAGHDPSRDPMISETPELVARAWAEEFLDGYRTEPRKVLASRMEAGKRGGEMVVLSDITFQSVCPHHLLPYGGRAHVAYLPGKYLAGFGQIGELIDCLSHRLVLQEDLTRQIAEELRAGLEAEAAGVFLEAEQSCMTLRGGRKAGATVVTEAYSGSAERQRELRERFRAALPRR